MELLRENRAEGVVVMAGGTIPPADVPELQRIGVARVFPTDSDTTHAIEFVKNLPPRRL